MNNRSKNKTFPKTKSNIAGYSMLELILAVFTGSIVLAGVYASYLAVAYQYETNSATSEIRDFAVPTIRFITRDLRMAGFRSVDNNIESTYGRIDNPVSITDTGASACCDSLSIIYDRNFTTRIRVTYFTTMRINPSRRALYMNIDTYNGSSWVSQTSNAIVTDYVEDFQIAGSNANSEGEPTLVSFNLIFRSRDKVKTTQSFIKSAYGTGNYIFTANDNYIREEFETSVMLRNIVE